MNCRILFQAGVKHVCRSWFTISVRVGPYSEQSLAVPFVWGGVAMWVSRESSREAICDVDTS